ncbi:hypothetical protein E1293_22565 [Actinomadura darangshiensis]|uniref:Uncharacterized protein n=1 Tax=Actinomadura darangshiensis TaxID=705336 RepID=A0A4R5B8T1_9ACTN|nr:hypothetical protein [Actinomadura darangshiensis]TDD79742.1 hypothetical protein E1293_22565 [Actinomadura darangshiensis]
MNSDDLFIIAMLIGSTVFTGAVAYTCTGRDLRGGYRISVALICAVLVGATCTFIPYLPVLAFLVTMMAYLVMRRLVSPGRALAAAAVLLLGGLSCAVLIMAAALETM